VHFWTSPFGTGLMGALVGGALSLAGTVLGFRLQSRREDRKHVEEQHRAVLLETAEWWASTRSTFDLAAQRLRDASARAEERGEPIASLAESVLDRVDELLAAYYPRGRGCGTCSRRA
jgi:hypothetical protein